MKKRLLLSLLLLGSTSYPIPCKIILWSLVSPVRSVDGEAQTKLRLWHEKKADGTYFWADDSYTNDGRQHGTLRAKFPENDPTSKDRLAKTLLLARHGRLIRISTVAQGIGGAPDQTFYHDYDYEATWQQQPKRDRFWWTIRYRRPYTYCSSIGKWGTEIAIVSGCVYAVRKLKNWYHNIERSKTKQGRLRPRK